MLSTLQTYMERGRSFLPTVFLIQKDKSGQEWRKAMLPPFCRRGAEVLRETIYLMSHRQSMTEACVESLYS